MLFFKIKKIISKFPKLNCFFKRYWFMLSEDLPAQFFPKLSLGKERKIFLNSVVQNKTVLIVETLECHGEVVPGFVTWFLENGYNVDLLLTLNNINLNPISRIRDNRVRVFSCTTYGMRRCLVDKKLRSYRYIIFTSRTMYTSPPNNPQLLWPTIFQYYPILNMFREKIISVEHHLDRVRGNCCSDSFVILANPSGDLELENRVVNFTTFGNVYVKTKNACTTFIVIGNIESARKNFDLLLSSFQIVRKQTDNFKVIVVARTGKLEIPNDIKNFFSFYQNVSYDILYSMIEKSDFILALLDPENEAHKRYLTDGTSGTFQLSYGFTKPCLIQKTFAKCYRFTPNNAIIYKSNLELSKAILKAIDMSSKNYEDMQNNLNKTTKDILNLSSNNLKNLLYNKNKD